MYQFIFISLFVLCGLRCSAADSLRVLTADQYMAAVAAYHPLAAQANLLPQQAKNELKMAQAAFDPQLGSLFNSKTYSGTNYYSYFENSVKIPLWYGIEVKAGYDFSYGSYLNPENKLPGGGLGYLGLDVPLGSNLVIDKKRAALKKAQLFKQASSQDRLSMLNDLFSDALKVYYNWCYSYSEYNIYREALYTAEKRLAATIKAAALGDRPYIDTTEALALVQNRQIMLLDAKLRFLNSALEAGNYLWQPNGEPMVFDTLIVPVVPDTLLPESPFINTLASALTNQLALLNPQLQLYNIKLKQLDIERKLKLENLKPQLNVQYGLTAGKFGFAGNAQALFTDNYKLGVRFSMPLTFMQARAEMKQIKINIQQTKYQYVFKQQQLLNKLKATVAELDIIKQQTVIYQKNLGSYRQLLDGESKRFINGESSLFLVNAREQKYIESQIKLTELITKYYKVMATCNSITGFAYKIYGNDTGSANWP
jgi:outer membrane protein TolC